MSFCSEWHGRWFALQVRPRHELSASALLSLRGYEVLAPLRWTTRRWSDRTKKLQVPMFPGYIFCRYDASCALPVKSTPGVIRVVGDGHRPLPIATSEIDGIRAVMRANLPAEQFPYLPLGRKVRIVAGALGGVEGVLLAHRSRHRLVLSVHLIQRSIAVEIERQFVAPATAGGLGDEFAGAPAARA